MKANIEVYNVPWAIEPSKLSNIVRVADAHARGESSDLAMIEAELGRPLQSEPKGYSNRDGVAVLPVFGVIAKRLNLVTRISGGISTELFARDLSAALADSAVHAIILQFDSPGGAVDGVQQLAQQVFAARGKKPIVALADSKMASAAYWIGAAAQNVYMVDSTTLVGSIGVVMAHVDYSKAEEKAGIKTTEIFAGKYKRIASEYAPLSDEGRATLQAMVDQLYSVMVDDVARFRGVSSDTVIKRMADGRIFMGQKAIDAGLVDGVVTLDVLIAKLKAGTLTGMQARATPSITAAVPIQPTARSNRMNILQQHSVETLDAIEARTRDAWDTSAALQEEFCGDYAIYLAYEKAVAKGLVKIHGGKVVRG
jgi:signal peptide peptidase SppA